MKISKSGNSYKIKCSNLEYLILKYAIFDIYDNKDDYMHDFVLENRVTDEEIEDIAMVMKGMD